MPEFAMQPFVRNAWYIAAWANEIDAGPVARRIMDEDLVLFRDGNGVAGALEDRCCHRGVRLSLGSPVANGIQCGYHGLVFGADGVCVDNPGETTKADTYQVRAFPVVERQHMIWIWMGDAARADESLIVDYPFHDMNDWPFHYGHYEIGANYMFMIDNLMDLTHLGYVHTSTIGGDPDSHNDAEMTTTRTENGAHFIRWMIDVPPPPSFANAGSFDGKIDRWSDFEYVGPSTVLQWGGALPTGTGAKENRNQGGGLNLRLIHHATPAADDTFHYFFSAAVQGHATDSPSSKGFFADVLEAFHEDKVFIEAQQEAISREPDRQLLLREHDKAVAYSRQAIRRMVDAEMLMAAE